MTQEKCECHKCRLKDDSKYCQCNFCCNEKGGYCVKICMLTNTYTCYCDWDAYGWNYPQVPYICNDCNSSFKYN